MIRVQVLLLSRMNAHKLAMLLQCMNRQPFGPGDVEKTIENNRQVVASDQEYRYMLTLYNVFEYRVYRDERVYGDYRW
jgi:hypothetical protein